MSSERANAPSRIPATSGFTGSSSASNRDAVTYFYSVTADESVGRDDFGVLAAMANALTEQRDSGEDELAHDSAEGILSALEARVEIGDGDALLATDGVIGDISMRETDPLSHHIPVHMYT